MRVIGAQSRREMAAAVQKAQETVERRRQELARRDRELEKARSVLAGCHKDCEGLRRQVHEAGQRRAEAKEALDRARRAGEALLDAQGDLIKVLQLVESKVGETSSVASSALAELDAKLEEVSGFNLAGATRGIVIGIATIANVASAAPDLAHMGGNAAAALGRDNSLKNSSFQEYRDDQTVQELGHLADVEIERKKRHYAGGAKEGKGDS